MKLLSLNVAIFEANNRLVEKLLLKQDADILCLQEVTRAIDKSTNPDYVSKKPIDSVTKDLKFELYNPITIMKDFLGKNFHKKDTYVFDFEGFVEMGNYIKSRFEIVKKEHIYLKKTKSIKITDWNNWPKDFATGVQIVDLQFPNSKKLRVLNYHGIWTKEKTGNEETLNACKRILELAKEVNYPTIIAGDFNLFPNTASMRVFYNDFVSLIDKHNISTTRPKSNELSHLRRNVVDYILVSKDLKINSFEVMDTNISDHLPLILDFDLP
jgi:endonuclease/exonuclease/phosphatase family metal-dependent hydrolase